MKTCWKSFNIYLPLLALMVAVGCETMPAGKKKVATTVRLHIEMPRDTTSHSVDAPIFRASPTTLRVDIEPFVTEASIVKAEVVENQGVYQVKLQFDRHGTTVLNINTTANRGKRIAIFSQFGDARWIGAVMINRSITDGTLIFTPDASREEAERFCRGLNNIAKELKKNPDF